MKTRELLGLRAFSRSADYDIEIFSGTKFVYKNSVQGDIWHFIGDEEIEHMENTIYELHYSGGYIESTTPP